MKAVVYREYGSPEVLELQDVDRPTPGMHEVLIKQRATTVTAADCMMRRGDSLLGRIILGLFRPKPRYRIIGIELAGEIVEVGAKVTRFRCGDQVFGFAGFSVGGYAQFNCLPQDSSLAIMPEALSFEEAAAVVDGATTALHFLWDKAKIQTGDRVLIVGASGSIGTSAVQLASHVGAQVTAVCSSGNAELVESLGADRVIDYTKEDFSQNGETYDVIFDTVGKSSFFRCRHSLATNGRYLATVGGLNEYLLTFWTHLFCKKKFIFGMSINKNGALQTVKELVESGAFKPVVDRRYALEEIVDAHNYVEKGHKKGNVVVVVTH